LLFLLVEALATEISLKPQTSFLSRNVISMSDEKLKKVAAALPEKVRTLANYELFELGRNAQHKVQDMLRALFDAALNATSVETVCKVKKDCPSADTIRNHLNWKVSLDAVEGMMRDRVRWLATLIKRRFGMTRFEIAIDWTDEPYYGDKRNPSIIGMEPKAGTCWAYEFFTASIVVSGGRLLLFVYPLYSRENLLHYVHRALLFFKELGIRPSLLLFDRGFRSTDLFAYLTYEAKIPFISPAVQDSRFERWVASKKDFPVRFNGWPMQNDIGETVEIDLIADEEFVENKKTGKMERQICGFYTNMPKKSYQDNFEIISEFYGRRWGIETAHRCEDDFRIKSTSVNGIVRYLYFVVSCLAYNLWVYLNLLFCEDAGDFRIIIEKDVLRLLCARLFGKFRI